MSQLTRNHFYLIEMAKNLIAKRFKKGKHHAVAALRTKSGKVFTGIQLRTTVPNASVCAVSAAVAAAACDGDVEIETIVAINRNGNIVAPCGACRELIMEYSPKAEILIPGSTGGVAINISKLLPIASALSESEIQK